MGLAWWADWYAASTMARSLVASWADIVGSRCSSMLALNSSVISRAPRCAAGRCTVRLTVVFS